METPTLQPTTQTGLFTKFLLRVAGADEQLLSTCPPHDRENICAVAEIQLCVFVYQAALFAIVTHRLFALPGQIRPDLICVSLFLAAVIGALDSYMFMRSGWHRAGLAELKRGGLDLSGGIGPKIKAGIMLAIRIGLSVCLAQLTAIFVSLLIFAGDIESQIQNTYAHANAALITEATSHVDKDARGASAAVDQQIARVSSLAGQVEALRQNQIDPSSGSPAMRQAQDELSQLLARQTKVDEDVRAAEIFASNELGGIKGAGNSGVQGDGPRHRAAVEQLANARARAKDLATAISTARERLDGLRNQLAASDGSARERAHDQLPGYENTLASEQAELERLKAALDTLNRDREVTIRRAVEATPGYVGRDDGLIAQVKILEHIASDDRQIAALILLIDAVSFGFELGAVLAKITTYIPTTYAALLARNAYMSAVAIVDGMVRELNQAPKPAATIKEEDVFPYMEAANDNPPPRFAARGSMAFGGSFDEPPPPPPRRPRGRPRKTPLN